MPSEIQDDDWEGAEEWGVVTEAAREVSLDGHGYQTLKSAQVISRNPGGKIEDHTR